MRLYRAALAVTAVALGLAVGCDKPPILVPVGGVDWIRITDASTTQNYPIHFQPTWGNDSLVFTAAGLNFVSGGTTGHRLASTSAAGGGGITFYSRWGRTRDLFPRWLDDSLLVFSSDHLVSGDFDIWVRALRSDTLSLRLLTGFPGDEVSPAPRPGAPGLAYVEATGNDDSGRLVLLPDTAAVPAAPIYLTVDTLEAGEPDWDPAGQRICFSVLNDDNTSHIYVVSMADTVSRQVTTGPFVDGFPRFSPDGRWILFSSNRTGRWGIWAVDPAGEAVGLKVVAFEDAGSTIGTSVWSPDGQSVILSSNGRARGVTIGPGVVFGEFSLWRVSNLP